jgi:hypothetical protein
MSEDLKKTSLEQLLRFLSQRDINVPPNCSHAQAWRLFQKYMQDNWRREPATKRQLQSLARENIVVPPHCTRGHAADLLNRAWGSSPLPTDYEHPFDERALENTSFKMFRDSKYHAYLRSHIWKEKCELVLRRCHGICERCHVHKVKQVHHMNYKNLYHEPLDDLQGVCGKCHLDLTNEQDTTVKQVANRTGCAFIIGVIALTGFLTMLACG